MTQPKKRRETRVNVDIDSEYLGYFRELFPQAGSLKWFLNEVLRSFFEIHNPKFDEDLRESVRKTVESLKEG